MGKTRFGLLALALAALLAWPVYSLASKLSDGDTTTTKTHTDRGNHCGQGHAKHAKHSPDQGGVKIGQACEKQSHPRSAQAGGGGSDEEADETGTSDDAATEAVETEGAETGAETGADQPELPEQANDNAAEQGLNAADQGENAAQPALPEQANENAIEQGANAE